MHNRHSGFPPHPCPGSPGYPSIHQHFHNPPFYRVGMNSPDSSPNRNGGGGVYRPHAMYPMYHNRNGHHTTPNSYGHPNFFPQQQRYQRQQQLQQPLPPLNQHHNNHQQQQIISPSLSFSGSGNSHQRGMYDDRFHHSDSFSRKRGLQRQQVQQPQVQQVQQVQGQQVQQVQGQQGQQGPLTNNSSPVQQSGGNSPSSGMRCNKEEILMSMND